MDKQQHMTTILQITSDVRKLKRHAHDDWRIQETIPSAEQTTVYCGMATNGQPAGCGGYCSGVLRKTVGQKEWTF